MHRGKYKMPESGSPQNVDWFLRVLLIVGIGLTFIFGLKQISSKNHDGRPAEGFCSEVTPPSNEPNFENVLSVPSPEWVKEFGNSVDSQIVYNIAQYRRILESHYKKIFEINGRLKKIEDANGTQKKEKK